MLKVSRFLIALAGAVAAACAAPQSADPDDEGMRRVGPRVTPAQVPPRVPSGPEEPGPRVTGEVPGDVMARLREDLAARAGAEAAEAAKVLRAESLEWPDGSLGCPEPGQMYTQAIVPGYRVDFEAAGRLYSYRVDQRGNFKLCEALRRGPTSR